MTDIERVERDLDWLNTVNAELTDIEWELRDQHLGTRDENAAVAETRRKLKHLAALIHLWQIVVDLDHKI